MRALYPCLGGSVGTGIPLACGVPPASCPTGDADVACLRAIASAGIEYLMAREQALEKCLDGVRLGRTAGPCPDLRTLARIAAADQRRLTRLATCRFLPAWWDVCPADPNGICSDDIASLVTMLVQTDKFGTSVAQSLRVHSDSLRTKRRQRAEEAAAKTGAKMVFPLVICIFPAIWIITVGSAVIKFIRILMPMAQQ